MSHYSSTHTVVIHCLTSRHATLALYQAMLASQHIVNPGGAFRQLPQLDVDPSVLPLCPTLLIARRVISLIETGSATNGGQTVRGRKDTPLTTSENLRRPITHATNASVKTDEHR